MSLCLAEKSEANVKVSMRFIEWKAEWHGVMQNKKTATAEAPLTEAVKSSSHFIPLNNQEK